MAMHAYDEAYLSGAQNVLGHAVDSAIMTLDIEPNVFGNALAVSESAKQFSEGNPRYVAGMNGCELARAVLDDVGISYPDAEDEMYMDKSQEYWAGWALAFYQWSSARPFMEILCAASLEDILRMYPVYHEMDVSRFVERLDALLKEAHPQTRLRERRSNCGLSQSDLAAEADVPLRQIQLFEQGQRDINKTSAITLRKLSKALHCRMEDLLEPEETVID